MEREKEKEKKEQQKDKRCGDNAASDKRLDGWIVLHLGPGTGDPTRIGSLQGSGRDRAGQGRQQANKPTEKRDDCT